MATQTASDRLYLTLRDRNNVTLLSAAARAMWSLQTSEEKTRRETFCLNGQGLDTADAKGSIGKICRKLYETQALASGGEAWALSEYLPKYADQLVRILNTK